MNYSLALSQVHQVPNFDAQVVPPYDSVIPGPTGNATVPNSAPILPPQAFVDGIAKVFNVAHNMELSGMDITYFSPDLLYLNESNSSGRLYIMTASAINFQGLDLSNNLLTQENVDAILARCVEGCTDAGIGQFSLDLSGANMDPPSEDQGMTDVATLQDTYSWTIHLGGGSGDNDLG